MKGVEKLDIKSNLEIIMFWTCSCTLWNASPQVVRSKELERMNGAHIVVTGTANNARSADRKARSQLSKRPWILADNMQLCFDSCLYFAILCQVLVTNYLRPKINIEEWHCFMICLNVKICSPQELPFRKSACSLRTSGSMAAEMLSRITLPKTLLVTDSWVIPFQFLPILRSPFFGNLTISPVFQSHVIQSF